MQKCIERMISALAETAHQKYIMPVRTKPSENDENVFFKFPGVRLILDCSVQKIPRFGNNYRDVKVFYSQKHSMYCLKKEYAHAIDGRVCFVSKAYPGSKHDFSVFLDNLEEYKKYLKKDGFEDEFYYIMADKGYEGAAHHLPAVLPKKGYDLDDIDMMRNIQISRCRIICENYYGRLKKLWRAASQQVKNDLSFYDDTITICVALTNYHVQLHPLRASEINIAEVYETGAAESITKIMTRELENESITNLFEDDIVLDARNASLQSQIYSKKTSPSKRQ